MRRRGQIGLVAKDIGQCTEYPAGYLSLIHISSGTLLLDVKNKRWHPDMLALCGINESQMPALYPSYAPVGTLLPEAARALGLPQGTVCLLYTSRCV